MAGSSENEGKKFELITACKPYGCGVWARMGGEYGRALPEGGVAITLFILQDV